MAIYRFKVSFEDYDAVREIDIKPNQTFEDFHYAIQKSLGYKPDYASSFYVSNDHWHKGTEITMHPGDEKPSPAPGEQASPYLMKEAKLNRFVEDPHQKFYYTFNFDQPIDFHIELTKILDREPGVRYPVCVKSEGEAPKQFLGQPPSPADSGTAEGDEDEPAEEKAGSEEENLMETEEYGIDEEDSSVENDEQDELGLDDRFDNEDIRKG